MRLVAKFILVVLLIAGILPASTGVVMVWVVAAVPAQSFALAQEDYPCKNHHCGCTSAEACRKHCCCNPRAAATPDKPGPKAPAPKPSLQMEWRAPSCGGQGGMALEASAWQAPPTSDERNYDHPAIFHATLHSIHIPDSRSFCPEPPPPRWTQPPA